MSHGEIVKVVTLSGMSPGGWILGSVSAVATVAMAWFSVKLYRVSDDLKALNQRVIDKEERDDKARADAIRTSVAHTLRSSEATLRYGIDYPPSLVITALNSGWVSTLSENDIAQGFPERDKMDVVIRAVKSMRHFVDHTLSMLAVLRGEVEAVVGRIESDENEQFFETIKLQAQFTLWTIEEAQKTCGFDGAEEWIRKMRGTPPSPGEVPPS